MTSTLHASLGPLLRCPFEKSRSLCPQAACGFKRRVCIALTARGATTTNSRPSTPHKGPPDTLLLVVWCGLTTSGEGGRWLSRSNRPFTLAPESENPTRKEFNLRLIPKEFHALLTPPSEFFSSFLHSTFALSVSDMYLAFEGSYLRLYS